MVDVQALAGPDPAAECRLAGAVRGWQGAEAVPGFGASDCRCGSHLAWFARRPGGSGRAAEVLRRLPAMFAVLARGYEDYTARARDPFRTLVTCLLSLRTRDPVTAAAAERLLSRWPSATALAAGDAAEIAHCIFPVGMFRQKARGLVRLARYLLTRCAGQVPADLAGLLALPGVGRKTANLVLSFAYHRPAVCVDTHVHRICNRWGLVRTAAPDATESELRKVLPQEYWLRLNPFLVQHGQKLCLPRRPRCGHCPLAFGCGYAALQAERALLARVPGAPGHPCLGAVLPSG
jgi:endonuclease III